MSPNLFYLVEYHHLRKHHGQLTVERGLVNFFAVRYKAGDEIQNFKGNEMTLEIESFMETVNTCKAVNFPFCVFDLNPVLTDEFSWVLRTRITSSSDLFAGVAVNFPSHFSFHHFQYERKAKLGERALNPRGEWGRLTRVTPHMAAPPIN